MRSYNCCVPRSSEFKQVEGLSRLLKLIGEQSRLKLLCLLRQGEHCVCEMPNHFEMSQSLISHHLADLKAAGLVTSRNSGRRAFYSLSEKGQAITNTIFSLEKEEK